MTASTRLARLTALIVAAYAGKNQLGPTDLSDLIASVMNGLTQAAAPKPALVVEPEPAPAVPIKKSVTEDFIVCLEDGKKFKSLRGHLLASYNMTPQEYRAKWKLPADYPMVAPNYAAARSALAHASGLGRKRQPDVAQEVTAEPDDAPAEAAAAPAEPAAPEETAKPAPKRRAQRETKQTA